MNKVALVTGAGAGIGRAAAIAFADAGYSVVISDIKEEGGHKTVSMLTDKGGQSSFYKADVSKVNDVKGLMEHIKTTYGRLDAAYNNAGIDGEQAGIVECSLENWKKTIEINLTGVYLCCQHEIPLMLANGGGSIVNCSSVAGKVGFPSLPAYVASKHGVIGLTKCIALDYATRNIRANAICPGVIETDMIAHIRAEGKIDVDAMLKNQQPIERAGTPKEVADAVVFLCSDAASIITGTAVDLDGGFLARSRAFDQLQLSMNADLDEATQLALALSISEAEAHASSENARRQTTVEEDAALAARLQAEEQCAADSTIAAAHNPPISNQPSSYTSYYDPSRCAGCHLPLSSPPTHKHNRKPGLLNHILSSIHEHTSLQPTRYITALNRNWHPSCFSCNACHKPLQAQFSVNDKGEPMHPECHKEHHHPRCKVCADYLPLQERNRIIWQETPFWGDKICPCHAADGTKRCTACTRYQPKTDDWALLDDGRALCLQCLGSVIPDTVSAQPLYQDVLSFFAAQGMFLPSKPPLTLVDDTALNAACETERRTSDGPIFHTRGLCLTEYSQMIQTITHYDPISSGLSRLFGGSPGGSGQRQEVIRGPVSCDVTAILVLKGLPRLLTGCIIAHETMHAWLRLTGYPKDMPPQVEEGLCQLMALLWLEAQHFGRQEDQIYEEKLAAFLGNQIRTDPSLVYGQGLRAALSAFQQTGLRSLLDIVKQTGTFPAM